MSKMHRPGVFETPAEMTTHGRLS